MDGEAGFGGAGEDALGNGGIFGVLCFGFVVVAEGDFSGLEATGFVESRFALEDFLEAVKVKAKSCSLGHDASYFWHKVWCYFTIVNSHH